MKLSILILKNQNRLFKNIFVLQVLCFLKNTAFFRLMTPTFHLHCGKHLRSVVYHNENQIFQLELMSYLAYSVRDAPIYLTGSPVAGRDGKDVCVLSGHLFYSPFVLVEQPLSSFCLAISSPGHSSFCKFDRVTRVF